MDRVSVPFSIRAAVRAFAVLAVAVAMTAGPARADGERPTAEQAAALVSGFGAQVLTLVSDPDLSEPDRTRALYDLLSAKVEMDFVGRLVLAGHQRRASDAELDRYGRVFPAFVTDRFGGLLSTYSGEGFEVGNVRELGSRDQLVEAHVIRPDGTRVPTHWRIRLFDGEPKVIDLMVENVSMVISQREEFDSVIRRHGLEGLLERLADQVPELASNDI
jgi:phospholipid transport system substrate-binding protein